MSKVVYGGQSYECGEKDVLDCLTAGVSVPSSCHSGVCQTCMMRAVKGAVPEKAQVGLKSTLVAQKYFLACSCYHEQDIEVALPDAEVGKLEAKVASVEYLNADILASGSSLHARPNTEPGSSSIFQRRNHFAPLFAG